MSHTPPLPDAATSPYPAHPAPIEHGATEPKTDVVKDAPAGTTIAGISARNIGLAAGAAIGSAAVAAALLFYNRPGSTTKRAPAKPAAKRATKPKAPTTRKPRAAAAKPMVAKTVEKAVAKPVAAVKAAVRPAPRPRGRPKKATVTE